MTRAFTAEELARCDGTNGNPLYISVKGKVYDCFPGAEFYGPGGPYAVFAGKEVSRPLGKMMIDDKEANAAWDTLSEEQMQTLDEWVAKFDAKYKVVGVFSPDEGFAERGRRFSDGADSRY